MARKKSDRFPIEMLRERIRERLEAVGMSARKASIEAGLASGAVSAILETGPRGNDNPTVATLQHLAAPLRCDLAYLIGTQDTPMTNQQLGPTNHKIPVVGTVEAGVFTAMSGPEPWASGEHELEAISAPKSERYPDVRHFAFRVRGDSMNDAKPRPIHEGEIALFVDIIDGQIPIVDGRIYLVRRTRDGGHTIEWTLKRARVFRDRIELVPESRNPVHGRLIIMPNGHGDDDSEDEIEAVGLLYGMHYSYEWV